MKKIFIFYIALLFTMQINAQHTVHVDAGGNVLGNLPYNNQFDYSWCTVIYPQDMIKIGGDITTISYRLNAYPIYAETAYDQKVFMAHTSDIGFTDAGYPDIASMTLVYDGSVNYEDWSIQETEITLTTPFSYNNTDNLIIHIENHDGTKNTEPTHNGFSDYSGGTTYYPCKYNQQDVSFPGTEGSRTHQLPNIFLTFASGLDAGISKINNNVDFLLPGLHDVTVNFSNYMADIIDTVDIDWEINGAPQATYNWSGSLSPGQESVKITLATDYDFNPDTLIIKAWTANPNAGIDEVSANDTMTATIYVADYIEIADDSYTGSNSWDIPFNRRSYQGWSASIINKDSLYLERKICGLAYNVVFDGSLRNNQTVFLSHIADDFHQTTAMPDETSMTNMFSGTVDYSGTGWKKISFDNIFEFNNSDNIMIYYTDKSNQWTSPATQFDASVYGGNAGLYKYNDASQEYPTGDGTTTARLPNIRLYVLIPSDAGITALDIPGTYFNTGNNDIAVSLKNFGTDILTSANIKYQIDNETINTFSWTSSLACYNTEQDIIIGNESFTYGEHTIKIWTDLPNGLDDYKNENDTIFKTIYATNPLCGNYVIGGSPSDYLTLKEAVDSLSSAGVSCDVVFDIKQGTYNSQYTINEINDAGQNSTITFQSQTGDSTDVILTTDSTDYLINLNGVDYIRFKHLTFTSDSAEKLVMLDSNACNNTFSGNVFTSNNLSSTLIYSGTYNDSNLVLQNNRFINGGNGIYLLGNTETEQSATINNNIFNNQNSTGIYTEYCKKLHILNNIIHSPSIGIYLKDNTNININANDIRLTDAVNGIFFYRCQGDATNRNYITNNFISGNISSAWNHSGIGLFYSSSFTNVYYNSINITGTEQAVYLYITDNINLINNIIINKNNNPIKVQSPTSLNSDYNCFYSENSSFNLSTCQSATGIDTHSIYESPYFVSDSDLHTNSLFIDNAGTPLPEITNDYDGDPRNIFTSDIGADEFTSTCTGPISGTYTIGSSGDYTTFNEAISALFECGVDSSVTFNIEAGTYNEQFFINKDISGYTEDDTIIFQSATGDSTSVILTYKADTLNNYTLKLNGADRFVFKQITIQSEDTTYGRVIEIGNGACNNLIQNCVISGDISDEDNNFQALVYFPADNTSRDTSNMIQENRFVNGSYGIYLDGGNNNKETFNTILGNYFTNQSAYGIYTDYQKNLLIEKNIIENNYQLNITYYGISINYYMDSTIISKNTINIDRDYISYGLHIEGQNNLVLNNFISLVSKDYHSTGILWLGYNSKCYNNSVNIYGSAGTVALDVTYSTSNAEIKNNNFANHADGYALKCMFGWSQISSSDYNNLYSNGKYIANWLDAGIVDLSDWQTASGFDSNSVSSYPNFVSNTDLHTSNVLLNNAATSLPEVTDDIDGEPRDATTPDIGADEFTGVTFSLGDDVTVCVDVEYKIDAGEGFDTYQWSTGADSSYILVDSIGIGYGSKEYYVTVTLGAEEYNDSVIVTFSSPTATPITDYCVFDSVLITAGEGMIYNWSTGDTTQSIYVGVGNYRVTVTDANGCSDNGYIYTHYNSHPANINIPDTTICRNQSVTLTANNSDNCSYYWSTGDTTQSIIVDSLTFGMGSHTFYVTVTNNQFSFNCESIDSATVTIDDCLGVGELENNSTFAIYPNPTEGIFTLEGENIQTIEIFNINGKSIIKKQLKCNSGNMLGKTNLDLSNQQKGIYFIKILTKTGLKIKKLILM